MQSPAGASTFGTQASLSEQPAPIAAALQRSVCGGRGVESCVPPDAGQSPPDVPTLACQLLVGRGPLPGMQVFGVHPGRDSSGAPTQPVPAYQLTVSGHCTLASTPQLHGSHVI